MQQLIDNLKTVVDTLAEDGHQFSGAIDRLERLTAELAADRDPIGDAIEALETGTASIADLLTDCPTAARRNHQPTQSAGAPA